MTTGDQLRLDAGFDLESKETLAQAGRGWITANKPAIDAYSERIANLEDQRIVIFDAIDFQLQGF